MQKECTGRGGVADYANRVCRCETCHDRYNTYRRVEQRSKITEWRRVTDAWKMAHGCVVCGYDENPDALEFDHVAPLRDHSAPRISAFHSHADATRFKALFDRNLQVLCANHHRIKTAKEVRS